jgi:aminoglycoside 3-N-acetyltransferase I
VTTGALRFPPAVPELADDAIVLRAPTEADIPAWWQRATDRESVWLAGDPVPISRDEGARWLQRQRDAFLERSAIRWAIVPRSAGGSVGTVGLTIATGTERTAELGVVVGRADRGRGFGTRAARLAVRYAFETLGVATVRAESLASNTASRRVLERAGLRLERVLPGFDVPGRGLEDGVLYVLRATEPHTRVLAPHDVAPMRQMLAVFADAFEDPDAYAARPPSDGYLAARLADPAFIAIAGYAGATMVGGLAAYELRKFEQERSEIYIYDLAVRAAFRRQGIATAMIEGLKDVARKRGSYVIFVQADHGDDPAVALYTKIGTREDVMHFDIGLG